MSWQPISTAPRGRENRFLGWDGEFIDTTWEGWTVDFEEGAGPVYVHADWVSWEPTHWMPLPDPPSDTTPSV